ncbi:MAG: hypothetical protein WBX15_20480 [Thermoanaerobaculia bacterium]
MSRERRRKDFYAILLLIVVSSLPLADQFAGQRSYIRDLTRYYYPTKRVIREVLRGGEFPFWNPYYSAGQPMAANPEYEVFYPPNWLILLPNYDLGYRLHILVHLWIAAIGMYLLLRSMRLRIGSAFLGAVMFAFSGVLMSLINLLPILFCASWIPLVLLFARRMMIRPNIRDFSLAALFHGVQILAVEPTTLAQTWFLIAAYGVWRAWREPPRVKRALRNVMLAALLALAGVVVGAVQFLPAIDHARDSARARPFQLSLVTAWSMPYARPLELLYPNVFGHVTLRHVGWYWASGMYPGTASPFYYSIYLGLLAAVLAGGGLLTRIRGSGLLICILPVSALLALGGNTPLFDLLYRAHLAQSVRYPEKFSLMGLIALIIFAARAFDLIRSGDRKLLGRALGVAAAIGVIALGIAVFSVTPWFDSAFRGIWGLKATANAERMVKMASQDWWLAAARAMGVFAILMILRRWKGAAVVTVAVMFVIVDLMPIAYEVNPREPASFFLQRPRVAATMAANHGSYRVFHEVDWYGSTDVAKKYFSTGSAVYWIVRNGLYPMTPATWGFRTVLERDYDKTALLPSVDLVESMWDLKRAKKTEWAEPFMAMSNVWYRAEYVPFDEEKKRTGGNFFKAEPVRFVDVGRNPRYYFADEAVTIRSRRDFVKKLENGTWPARVAFIRQPAFPVSPGTVLHARETHSTIDVDARANGPSLLVLSVTPHKYWKAWIDGRRVPLITTNIGYQSVRFPAGRHHLRLAYVNWLVLVSGVISLSMTGLLLSWIVISRSRDEEPA